jgi:regulatory protein
MTGGAPPEARRSTVRRPLSLKARALSLLTQREHSEAELRRKLMPHAKALKHVPLPTTQQRADEPVPDAGVLEAADDVDPSARIDEVIEWLRAHRYLDDQRFVESRLHARASRYGNLRIRQELAQHGLDRPEAASQALQASEFDRAREVWQRRFGTAPTNAADHARQARFLAQRGFSAEVVSKLLRRSRHQRSEEEPDVPADS